MLRDYLIGTYLGTYASTTSADSGYNQRYVGTNSSAISLTSKKIFVPTKVCIVFLQYLQKPTIFKTHHDVLDILVPNHVQPYTKAIYKQMGTR